MLVTALRPRVEEALRVKLAAALRPKIVDELRRTLAAALRPRLEAAVRAQLEADLKPRIELELRTRFEQQFAEMQTQAKSRAPQAVAPASESASSTSDDDAANRLFACLGEAAFATDAHGMLTRVNTACTQLFRRTEDGCIGKALADLFVEEDRRGVAGFLSRVAQGTAISLVYEGQLERGEGETLWIELRAAPLASTSGEATGACGVLRDTSDAKRAAAEHEDASLQLLLMVDETDAGVLIEDIDGTIKQVNPAFCALFGVQAAPFSLEGSASAELIQELGFSFADVDELLTLMARIRGAAEDVDGCDIRLSGRRVARLSYRAVAEDGPPRGHLWIFRLATPAVSTENP
jgi:PAS domain S-box-containing protein